jgi:hypothetical protein
MAWGIEMNMRMSEQLLLMQYMPAWIKSGMRNMTEEL